MDNSFLYLEKWTEWTEKIWQRPLLEEGGLELERDDQQTDDDVRQGQVGDKEVRDGLKHNTVREGFSIHKSGLRTERGQGRGISSPGFR